MQEATWGITSDLVGFGGQRWEVVSVVTQLAEPEFITDRTQVKRLRPPRDCSRLRTQPCAVCACVWPCAPLSSRAAAAPRSRPDPPTPVLLRGALPGRSALTFTTTDRSHLCVSYL